MHLQYASDLHLEMNDNENFLRQNPLIPSADVLVLAGDIVPFKHVAEYAWFFDWVSANFEQTYWVPGNHEYYHYDLANKKGSFCETIRHNISLVNDYAVTMDDVRLIFSTLWTSIGQQNQIAIERGMNDFHLIKYHGNRLTSNNLRQEHETSLAFIEYELLREEAISAKMVITHHVPTLLHYPPQYLHTVLNEAFAVELKQMISALKPDYWLYGHHHQNTPEFTIDKTKMITNQLGYVRYDEHRQFDPAKVVIF